MSVVLMRNSVAYDAVNGNNGKMITQVIRAVVKFWGRERYTYGVHDSYHCYLVLSAPWQKPAGGVASVFGISDAEQLNQRNFWVDEGGQRAAYNKAVATLKSLPENSGLEFGEDEG